MTDIFKVGDEIRLKFNPDGEVVIVEQVMRRGLVPHYLCSWRDQPWKPITYSHEFAERVSND